ncbi:MAG: peptidoglycan-binding domain-containing protein, partial [Rhodospirillaceae bacterium]
MANRPDDIVAVKQRLHRLGFYEPPPEGIGDDIDAEFETAIRAFQQDNGLQVDGRLEPGGETERNLVAIDDDEIENLLSGPTDIRLGGR